MVHYQKHLVIQTASLKFKDVTSVPPVFDAFQGYNEIKRKKLKSQPLDARKPTNLPCEFEVKKLSKFINSEIVRTVESFTIENYNWLRSLLQATPKLNIDFSSSTRVLRLRPPTVDFVL